MNKKALSLTVSPYFYIEHSCSICAVPGAQMSNVQYILEGNCLA